MNIKKISLLIIISLTVFYIFNSGLINQLNFTELKSRQSELFEYYLKYPWRTYLTYFLVYVICTALSLPGATVLTLGSGAIFGFVKGTLLVSFASTIGATIAFLITRYLFRETIEKKFQEQVNAINKGVDKEGGFYLFTLRLIPVFPFFLINMVMGLTKMSVWTFALISQIGMILGTMIYVNAGTQIAQIESTRGILSLPLLSSLILLGLLPLLTKKIVSILKVRSVYKGFKKPKKFDYNVLVIGGGSAGLVTSYIASAVKAKVGLIEKNKMGGECLNTGCVPSKALIKSSKVMKTFLSANKFGLNSDSMDFDFSKVMNRVQDIISKIGPHDSIERYTSLGVDCIQGEAEILSPWEVKVNDVVYKTKNVVLAIGATPIIPNIPGIDKIAFKTSETIWDLQERPKKMLVLGAGPVGCEMAQAFARLGCEVTMVTHLGEILQKEDSDVSEELVKHFLEDGIKIFTQHEPILFDQNEHKKWITLKGPNGTVEIDFNEVLIAVGRRANTKIKGLEKLNLDLGEHGTFSHDEFLRTKYSNIYVCGDCAGPYQFSHMASHQAWYASVNALFSPLKSFRVDYRVVPWATFTDPEIARVGLSEKEARLKGIEYEVSKYELEDLDRAIADSENYGFVKVLTPKGSDRIIGVTIVSSRASDMLPEFVLAMKWGLGLNKILGTIHTYPTFSDAAKYAAGNWKKNHKPEGILRLLEKFHAWRRN